MFSHHRKYGNQWKTWLPSFFDILVESSLTQNFARYRYSCGVSRFFVTSLKNMSIKWDKEYCSSKCCNCMITLPEFGWLVCQKAAHANSFHRSCYIHLIWQIHSADEEVSIQSVEAASWTFWRLTHWLALPSDCRHILLALRLTDNALIHISISYIREILLSQSLLCISKVLSELSENSAPKLTPETRSLSPPTRSKLPRKINKKKKEQKSTSLGKT